MRSPHEQMLLRRGLALEYATLGWNVAGVAITTIAALAAGSVALAGFGLDSLIEIGASLVVIWQLTGASQQREHQAMRLIGSAFVLLVIYLLALTIYTLATGAHPNQSLLGIGWTSATLAVMLALAAGKTGTGRAGQPRAANRGASHPRRRLPRRRPARRPRDHLLRHPRSPRRAHPPLTTGHDRSALGWVRCCRSPQEPAPS